MKACPEIKRFVQETLGCSCPEEVFDHIDYQEEGDGITGRKVIVGGRLLIYIITVNGKSNIQEVIDLALERGVLERDGKGLNRFRLVLVASQPDELRNSAGHAFESSGYTDEKTYLHIVNEGDVESI